MRTIVLLFRSKHTRMSIEKLTAAQQIGVHPSINATPHTYVRTFYPPLAENKFKQFKTVKYCTVPKVY